MIKPWMFGTHGNLPSTTNLVGYWPFNETSGTNAPDESGNGNDGTLVNMEDADWVDGVVGKCLDFGGTDEYVSISNDAALNFTGEDFSLSLWVQLSTKLQNSGILIKGDIPDDDAVNYGIDQTAAGWNFLVSDSSGVSSHTTKINSLVGYDVGVWRHIAATYEHSTTTMKLYVDGILVESGDTLNAPVTANTGSLRIASYANLIFTDGKIDEVRIYSTALTASEIKALYDYPAGV